MARFLLPCSSYHGGCCRAPSADTDGASGWQRTWWGSSAKYACCPLPHCSHRVWWASSTSPLLGARLELQQFSAWWQFLSSQLRLWRWRCGWWCRVGALWWRSSLLLWLLCGVAGIPGAVGRWWMQTAWVLSRSWWRWQCMVN